MRDCYTCDLVMELEVKPVLLVCHCPSPNVSALRDAVAAGARAASDTGRDIVARSAFDTTAEDVLGCGAIILGTTENFGYMNGALKDFFERIYYPCLDQTPGLPYALFVKGGQDGHGARASVERIVTGLRWRPVQAPLIMTGTYDSAWLAPCEELGATVAAGLDAGVI